MLVSQLSSATSTVQAGNHEYYCNGKNERELRKLGVTMDVIESRIAGIAAAKPNLHFLQSSSVLLEGGVRVLGATLWADIPADQSTAMRNGMRDYSVTLYKDADTGEVERFNPAYSTSLHHAHVDWLRAEIEAAATREERVVVLTHHAPLLEANEPCDSARIAANCSDLRDLMGPPVALWAFGHTHCRCDVDVSGTRVVANCKGYPGQTTGFDPSFVVTVMR